LTSRKHQSPSPYELEADPASALLLADAGFDVLSLANNHLGDAGPEGILDTVEAVESTGLKTVGAGTNLASAAQPLFYDVAGLRVAVVAFDASRSGLAAGSGPGVAPWDEKRAQSVVESASRRADLLVASLHGGVEYLPETDPRMLALAKKLVTWGADVVWGHGAHVVQPAIVAGDDRRSLIVTSLGNFIFDQRGPLTGRGAMLQVLADRAGVIAYRMGDTTHTDLRVHWVGWNRPQGDAVLIDAEWWHLIRQVRTLPNPESAIEHFQWGEVLAASDGRVTGVGLETVVSFRQLPRQHPVRDGLPDLPWVDAQGMTSHLGIYRAGDLAPIWVAGMVPSRVAKVAACDGAIALAYSGRSEPGVVAASGATWRTFGLDLAEPLPGPGRPGCADVDGDGRSDPVILDRTRDRSSR
jgi:hypothetical protein